jgi:hypothetical protein
MTSNTDKPVQAAGAVRGHELPSVHELLCNKLHPAALSLSSNFSKLLIFLLYISLASQTLQEDCKRLNKK